MDQGTLRQTRGRFHCGCHGAAGTEDGPRRCHRVQKGNCRKPKLSRRNHSVGNSNKKPTRSKLKKSDIFSKKSFANFRLLSNAITAKKTSRPCRRQPGCKINTYNTRLMTSTSICRWFVRCVQVEFARTEPTACANPEENPEKKEVVPNSTGNDANNLRSEVLKELATNEAFPSFFP